MRKLIVAFGLAVPLVAGGCASSAPAPKPSPTVAAPAKAAASPAASGAAASPAASGDAVKGKAVFDTYCSACHGKNAEGLVGPDLRKIGATRDRDYLSRWLADPAAVKPGATMPKLPLTEADLKASVEYLLTLK